MKRVRLARQSALPAEPDEIEESWALMERTDAVGEDSDRAVQLAKYLDLDIATKKREAVRADQKCLREYSETNATTFREALADAAPQAQFIA
eukprot:5791294-Pyramimonas_sp.AAC.1